MTVTAGDLTFQPTETNNDNDDVHMIAGATKDDDYLSFGYWVQTSTKSDGSMAYGVNTFAGGSMTYGTDSTASAALLALHGKATYEGPSTGMYALKALAVEDGKVVGTPSEAGQFVADASLTAYFGTGGTAGADGKIPGAVVSAADSFTIKGMVENFQNADGDTIDGNWIASISTPLIFKLSRALPPKPLQGPLVKVQWQVDGAAASLGQPKTALPTL